MSLYVLKIYRMYRYTDGNLIERLQYATTTPNKYPYCCFIDNAQHVQYIIELTVIYQCIVNLLSTLSKFLTLRVQFNGLISQNLKLQETKC